MFKTQHRKQRENQKSAKFNQEFRFLLLGKLKEMIEYKARLFGIEVLQEPEPYTSKVSSVSGKIEVISGKIKEEKTKEDLKNLRFKGKRVKRGLFRENLAIKKLGKKAREEF